MTTILIADDDRKITDMLRRTLGYEGYRVLTASDGLEALAVAEAERPDAVVLDWLMPGLDGVEVRRRLGAGGHPVPAPSAPARGARRSGCSRPATGWRQGSRDWRPGPKTTLSSRARRPSCWHGSRCC